METLKDGSFFCMSWRCFAVGILSPDSDSVSCLIVTHFQSREPTSHGDARCGARGQPDVSELRGTGPSGPNGGVGDPGLIIGSNHRGICHF